MLKGLASFHWRAAVPSIIRPLMLLVHNGFPKTAHRHPTRSFCAEAMDVNEDTEPLSIHHHMGAYIRQLILADKHQEALDAVQHAMDSGIVPPRYAFKRLLLRLCTTQYADQLIPLYDAMVRIGHPVDEDIYLSVMKSVAKTLDRPRLIKMLGPIENSTNRNLHRTLVLLYSYFQLRQFEEAINLLNELRNEDLGTSKIVFELLSLYSHVGSKPEIYHRKDVIKCLARYFQETPETSSTDVSNLLLAAGEMKEFRILHFFLEEPKLMDKLTVRQVQNIGMKLATFEYWKLNTQTWKSYRKCVTAIADFIIKKRMGDDDSALALLAGRCSMLLDVPRAIELLLLLVEKGHTLQRRDILLQCAFAFRPLDDKGEEAFKALWRLLITDGDDMPKLKEMTPPLFTYRHTERVPTFQTQLVGSAMALETKIKDLSASSTETIRKLLQPFIAEKGQNKANLNLPALEVEDEPTNSLQQNFFKYAWASLYPSPYLSAVDPTGPRVQAFMDDVLRRCNEVEEQRNAVGKNE